MSQNDLAQMGLAQPDQVDWDNAFSGSSYVPPPPALGPDGKPIVYYGVALGANVETEYVDKNADGQPVLTMRIDPIKIVKSGQADGYQLRFTTASVATFLKNGQPMKGNPNRLGTFLKAAGIQAKPQTNEDYVASTKAAVSQGRVFPFTLDWEAKDADAGVKIRGYASFPDDPARPGQKKSILKAGDFYNELDQQGNVIGQKKVVSEVVFANARVRRFYNPKQQG